MKVSVKSIKIQEILANRHLINLAPIYQRGDVWSAKKRKLLIDSVLTGIDIPKIYLTKVDIPGFDYEISDGKQRLRTIFDFATDDFKLDRFESNGKVVVGQKYSELSKELQNAFDNYELTVSYIEESNSEEVRELFKRLQMGEHLIPSELRNAVASNISYAINMLVNTNVFFTDCKIPLGRFKHQDYISHALALVHYENKAELKAALLLRLYQELSDSYPEHYFQDAIHILAKMNGINKACGYKIKTKWAFVDIFYFLYRNIKSIEKVDEDCFGKSFVDFEKVRLANGANPENLLNTGNPEDGSIELYYYIQSFKSGGGNPKSIQNRQAAFDFYFTKCISA